MGRVDTFFGIETEQGKKDIQVILWLDGVMKVAVSGEVEYHNQNARMEARP